MKEHYTMLYYAVQYTMQNQEGKATELFLINPYITYYVYCKSTSQAHNGV